MGAATDAALATDRGRGGEPVVYRIGYFTVDKFRRRPLMIIGALVMAVSMLILGTTFYTRRWVWDHWSACWFIRRDSLCRGTGLLGVTGRDLPELDPLLQ